MAGLSHCGGVAAPGIDFGTVGVCVGVVLDEESELYRFAVRDVAAALEAH
jgi:hypothetical protein